MQTKISSMVLAAFGIASLSVVLPMSAARAQEKVAEPPVQEKPAEPAAQSGAAAAAVPIQEARLPPLGSPTQDSRPIGTPRDAQIASPEPDRFAQPYLAPMPAQGAPYPQMMPMAPQSTMIADGNFLFVLRGDQIFKLNKSDLRIVAVGMLPNGMRPMAGPTPDFRGRDMAAPLPGGGRGQATRPAAPPRVRPGGTGARAGGK